MKNYYTRADMERMIKIAFQMNRRLLADGFKFTLIANSDGARLIGESELIITFAMENHSTMFIDFRLSGEVLELTFQEFIDYLKAEKELRILRGTM